MTTTTSVTNWIQWFDSRPSATIIDKGAQGKLFDAFNHQISTSLCETAVSQHNEVAFLFKENFGKGRVAIFHHFNSIGGTVYNNNVEIGFIQGMDNQLTMMMTPDTAILFEAPTGAAAQVPTPTGLLGVTTKETVANLTTGTRTTYKARNFIPIVPFMLNDIAEAIRDNDGSAAQVLVQAAQSIKTFDTDHANDADYTEKAKQQCKDILSWLYLVATDSTKISATPTKGCTNIGMVTTLNGITSECLTPNKPSPNKTSRLLAQDLQNQLKRPLDLIAASTSSNQDYLRKLTQIQTTSQEKSSKSFSKLPSKYRTMILIASSVDESTMGSINPAAEEFFKCSNLLHANTHINSLLEAEQIECSISNAMTTSLWNGSLLWVNSVTPSGLACSVITTEDIMTSDTLYQSLVLDYSTRFEINESTLEKLTKTQVRFPKNIDETIERFRALQVLCKLLFGRVSLPAQGLHGLVVKCQDNKRLLRTHHSMEEEFIPKLMCSVDHRLYQWLRQCSLCSTVQATTVTLLDFAGLFEDIMMHRFHYILPLSVKKLKEKPPITTREDSSSRVAKKPRQSEYARNPSVPQEWKLRQGEKWDTVFRSKTLQGLDLTCGSKFCLKYWVKGLCYTDCRQHNSHVTLSEEDKKRGDDYIKELRGE